MKVIQYITVLFGACFLLKLEAAEFISSTQQRIGEGDCNDCGGPSQKKSAGLLEQTPWIRLPSQEKHPAPYRVTKLPGTLTPEQWGAIVDSTWGPGYDSLVDAALWQTYWNDINDNFACFNGLDPNLWDDVWTEYWPEIEAGGISKGRMCSIIESASYALKESHTFTWDRDVVDTDPAPGVPVLQVGIWGDHGHFGAALTPLEDSSALVYRAVPSHPLGLEPGDRVLGYDRRPWAELYPELLDAGLPSNLMRIGSSQSSIDHCFLMMSGMNWHLFDTIDIVKYGSTDTLHLATSVLDGQNMYIWASEQMDIPGVTMPEVDFSDVFNWGVVDGTNIGYIYSLGWGPVSDSAVIVSEWLSTLDHLQNVQDVDGLIIDLRLNLGAWFDMTPCLEYFFDTTFQFVDFYSRCGGRTDLCPSPGWGDWCMTISGNPSTYWDRPIAILLGPGASSGGDLFPLMLSVHSMAKIFGKPSCSAYSGNMYGDMLWSGWSHSVADHATFLTANPGQYIAREEFPGSSLFPWVDYQTVWLTSEMVAQGKDDVVEAALAWIDSISNASCCNDTRGNANDDLDDKTNIADVTYLVSYLFGIPNGPEPVCPLEGNINGDPSEAINISDVTYLVAYLFGVPNGPAPPSCP